MAKVLSLIKTGRLIEILGCRGFFEGLLSNIQKPACLKCWSQSDKNIKPAVYDDFKWVHIMPLVPQAGKLWPTLSISQSHTHTEGTVLHCIISVHWKPYILKVWYLRISSPFQAHKTLQKPTHLITSETRHGCWKGNISEIQAFHRMLESTGAKPSPPAA